MTLLPAHSHRRMPWANGGGTTYEVAIDPPGASMGDFDWRVSLADIEVDGPFSLLAGIDRILVLTSGRGMDLSIDGRVERLYAGDVVRFAGEAEVVATLTDGPTRDLNIMTRRDVCSAEVCIVTESTVVTAAEEGAWTCVAPLAGTWSTKWGTAGAGDVVLVHDDTHVSGSGMLAVVSIRRI